MGGTIIAKPSDPSKMGGGNDGVPSGSEEWACRTHHEGGRRRGGEGRRVKAILGGGGLELERPGA